jgi:hypothetical protein
MMMHFAVRRRARWRCCAVFTVRLRSLKVSSLNSLNMHLHNGFRTAQSEFSGGALMLRRRPWRSALDADVEGRFG